MNALKIVANHDAADLASRLEYDLVAVEVENFVDTESVVRFKQQYDLVGAVVLLIYRFYSFAPSISITYSVNNELMKFWLLAHTLKSCQVKKIIGFLPYLAYSRQEGDGLDGAISFIGALSNAAGIDAIITNDVHSLLVHQKIGIPFYALNIAPFWAGIIREHLLPYCTIPVCIAAPDEGGIDRARAVADLLRSELVIMKKERLTPDHAQIVRLDGDVTGKTVVIVDDIIDTGRTAISACDLLVERGAVDVIGCFTHPVLSIGALERLQRSQFSQIFITDTLVLQADRLPDKITQVSVNKFFADALPGCISTLLK
jgi:ribose-phosphate pyrophosphokinase